MYNIKFFRDDKGNSPIEEYIDELRKKANKSKDSRIKHDKIMAYLLALRSEGTRLGEPVVKHLQGEIWELRPLRDRLLFAVVIENEITILHHFIKSTQKTPKREIEKALQNLKKYKEGWV